VLVTHVANALRRHVGDPHTQRSAPTAALWGRGAR
jgi:hypothetical protein